MKCSCSLAVSVFGLALVAVVAVAANKPTHLSLVKKQRNLDCSNSKVWCQSVPNAFACETMDYCKKAIWSKQKKQSISTSVCEECIQTMEIIKAELKLNSSKQFVEELLDAICWSMLTQRAICELALHASFENIYEMLNSSVQNEDICNSLPFCVTNVKHDLVHVLSQKHDPESCPKCFDFIQSAKNRFVSKEISTKRSFFARLIPRLCILTFGNQDFCFSQNVSTEQFDIISDFVENNLLDKEICSYTSLCLESDRVTSVELDQQSKIDNVKSSTECDMCKIIFRNVQQLLVTNSTFEKFKTNVENLCSKMVKNPDICNKDLDKYLNVVYNTMKEPSFPDLVCTLIDVCISGPYKNPFISSKIESKPKLQLNISEKSGSRKEIDFGDQMDTTDVEKMRKLYRCHFVAFIKQSIVMGRDNEQIKDDFSSVCGKIPLLVHSKNCQSFYEKQLDQIIVLVRSKDIESKSCGEAAPPFLPKTDQDIAIESKEDCLVCHLLMSKFKKMLSKNKTIDEVETYLKKACQMVKEEKLKDECDRFIDTYGDKLIQMMNSKFTPKYICKEIGICSAETLDEFKRKVDDCSVCVQSTKALSQHMSDRLFNVSDASQLMAVCNDVAQKNVIDQCKKMMKSFGKSFAVLMQENLSPLEVCYRTGLCAKTANQRPVECFDDYTYAFQSVKNALQCNNVPQFLLHHNIVLLN